jgi:hypothetical protein
MSPERQRPFQAPSPQWQICFFLILSVPLRLKIMSRDSPVMTAPQKEVLLLREALLPRYHSQW